MDRGPRPLGQNPTTGHRKFGSLPIRNLGPFDGPRALYRDRIAANRCWHRSRFHPAVGDGPKRCPSPVFGRGLIRTRANLQAEARLVSLRLFSAAHQRGHESPVDAESLGSGRCEEMSGCGNNVVEERAFVERNRTIPRRVTATGDCCQRILRICSSSSVGYFEGDRPIHLLPDRENSSRLLTQTK
jgi:hypothetical protein